MARKVPVSAILTNEIIEFTDMQSLSLNFQTETLHALTDKIKASLEGRIDWGDTFGLALGIKGDKHLIVWTPKETSEGEILPGFDSEDGKLTLKMKPRPGAWVSWIDETRVAAEIVDDHDRVYRSVHELERNARQITDFADGVLSEILVQHLGTTHKLSTLTQEILQSRLAVPSTIKTGGYILARATDNDIGEIPPATVIIPEQTHIHRLHLNEDVLMERLREDEGHEVLLVVLRTHLRRYPDLIDLEYCLNLQSRLADGDLLRAASAEAEELPGYRGGEEEADAERALPVRVLATAAAYDALEPTLLKLVPIAFTAPLEEIASAIHASSEYVDTYMVKANQHAYQLMTEFQQGVETRLRALVLSPGQRVHNKVWDGLVTQELRNTLEAFVAYYAAYLTEHFEEEAAQAKVEALTQSIEPLIEFWQLQDSQQVTLNHLIQSSYRLTNQVLDRAAGLFHELMFEKDLIGAGLVSPVELLSFENGELLDEIYLPEWTRASVREKISGIELRSTYHARQIERLRTIWLELLSLANFASQHRQDFEVFIGPLADLLLAPKTLPAQRRRQAQRRMSTDFAGFEIADEAAMELLNHVKSHFPTIKRWLAHAPVRGAERAQHYANLWLLVFDGKLREQLLEKFQPTCDITLSVPDQTKRLINLTLGSTLIIQSERDRKTLERQLNRAVNAKTGHELSELLKEDFLAIHGDVLLASFREGLQGYRDTVVKRAARLANAPRRGKNRRRGQPQKAVDTDTLEALEAEREKVTNLIAFLEPYVQAEAVVVLAEAGLNPRAATLEDIRKKQVLSFDVSELPAIGETWLEGCKTVADYPNLRVFLVQNQLPISTTGRLLMDLRQRLPDELFNHVLGLIQEVKALQTTEYQGELLEQFIGYLAEKVWRWELTQITEAELPLLLKEKVLAAAICYEKEVESLMEYVERYDELVATKLTAGSALDSQRQSLEAQFQEIVEALL